MSTSTDVSETSGRGSGLTAIKAIADKLKGSVKLKAQDQGTLLVVTLPKEPLVDA